MRRSKDAGRVLNLIYFSPDASTLEQPPIPSPRPTIIYLPSLSPYPEANVENSPNAGKRPMG